MLNHHIFSKSTSILKSFPDVAYKDYMNLHKVLDFLFILNYKIQIYSLYFKEFCWQSLIENFFIDELILHFICAKNKLKGPFISEFKTISFIQ